MMDYETLWRRLTPLYDIGEAKALIRWVLEVRFGLSMADILCGKVNELSADDQKELNTIIQRLEKGEHLENILASYPKLSDEEKEMIKEKLELQ